MPFSSASRIPASTGLMNSRGMTPPTILSSKMKPSPGFDGSRWMTTWPYWPLPPDCRMNFPSTSVTLRVIVSRKATCGWPTLASTLNSRFIRSTRISRCSSPMPAMMVCEVSGSVRTRKVGILFLQLLQRDRQLVLVGLGLRLDGDVDHRVGELHRLQDDRAVLVAQRIAGAGVLEPDRRADVARPALPGSLPACWRASAAAARPAPSCPSIAL